MAKNNSVEVKTFRDLQREIHKKGLCGKCGGCVSFCSAGELNALCIGDDGIPEFSNPENCLDCGICYLICPETEALNPELKEKFLWRAPVGRQRTLASARTKDKKLLEAATDGGVVTALLLHALDKGLIRGAIVSKRTGPFSRQPVIATTPAQILEAAGTHFDASSHLEEVGERYTTYSPTMHEVKVMERSDFGRMAMVGTPCQINTVRKMQVLGVLPANAFIFTIGLFCMENLSFGEEARGKLEKLTHVKLDDVRKLNIKDDVILTTDKGERVHLPFEAVDEFARPACLACSNFANDFADISCGGLGSPDGYTTTLVRTELGEKIYNGAKNGELIEELSFKDKEERKIHRTKLSAKIISFAKMKKERAKKVLANA
ncbi:MAG: Coenzyme F420 hydrogenase/dehydrogenase, beta subunit C-terminal domain [Candidatus Latescibacterota bacterium]